VRQAAPICLSVDQLSQLIYGELKQRERVMVLLDFGTGLQRGELSGVRWEDIRFDDKVLISKRSIVKQRIGKVKTEASKKGIPLDDAHRRIAVRVGRLPMPKTATTSSPARR
jgi:integrase